MPSFSYLALDEGGRELRGRLEALSEAALESRLRKEGQWLVEARAVSHAAPPKRKPGKAVRRRVLIEFFLELGMQLKSGIPVVAALSHGIGESENPGFQAVQQSMLGQVKAGRSLSEAMAMHPRTFSPLVLNLVRSAEASGQVAETCYQIRGYYEWVDRLVSEVRRALIYPFFVSLAALAFVVLIFSFVVPKFAELFIQLKMPLPAVTAFVMGISHFLLHWGWLVLAGAALAAVLLVVLPRRYPVVADWRDRAWLHLPFAGDLLKLVCISRFARNLAIVFGAGVHLLEALKLCRNLAGNRVLARAIDDVRMGVGEGRKMHETMSRHPIFSPLVLRLIEVGEHSGTLPEALNNLAEYFQEQLSRLVKKRLAILEPLLILFLIGVVGLVAIALILPIASLLNLQ